jgi:hypothetical protein
MMCRTPPAGLNVGKGRAQPARSTPRLEDLRREPPGEDLPHPSSLSDEGYLVLFTCIGVGIGVVVMLLATLIQERSAQAAPATT